MNENKIPAHIKIERGQTQKNVNKNIILEFLNRFPTDTPLKVLDLPCGKREFISYVHALYPQSDLTGVDIVDPPAADHSRFFNMDLSKPFTLPDDEKYDVITSISGIMMFGNTQNFIEQCSKHMKPDAMLIVTNDNPATIKDRLSYFFLARFRIFDQVFEDHDTLTKLVLIQDLTRLMRINGIQIEKITYTSFYLKDIVFLPIVLLVYPFQFLYLMSRKSAIPKKQLLAKYNLSQLLCRHYIIVGRKK